MPTISDLFDQERIERFRYFISERHHVYLNRVNGIYPLTTDETLTRFRFCNVFRFLDRGSQWIISQLNSEYGRSLSERETLMICSLYRRTNSLPAWDLMKSEYGLPRWDDVESGSYLEKMHNVNDSFSFINNRAYNVGNDADRGVPLIDCNFHRVQNSMRNGLFEVDDWTSWSLIRDSLMRGRGVHLFISQQIVTDFGYSQYGGSDWENSSVNAGPGSMRGMKRLLRVSVPDSQLVSSFYDLCRILMNDAIQNTTVSFEHESIHRDLSLMDIQNCLCEFDKYCRYADHEQLNGRRFAEKTLRLIPDVQIPISWRIDSE